MSKRKSCRAIIIENNSLVTMYRERENKVYYTFPGGGMEDNETFEECVIRECKEEFGIDVKPVKQVYLYENEKTIQYFYLCEWLSGELGSGEGEEFQSDRNRGIYMPVMMPIAKIPNLPLMPPEIAEALFEDLKNNSIQFSNKVKVFNV